MKKTDLNRRDFNRLSMAAFGGVVAGSLAGCGGDGNGTGGGDGSGGGDGTGGGGGDGSGGGTGIGDTPTEPTGETGGDTAEHSVSYLLEEPHVCRGLNSCENKGQSGQNECAGQGTCYTPELKHDCHFQNKCEGQGGCGEYPGQNSCAEKGECGVPLSSSAWEKARAAFETAMTDADKQFGNPPAAPAE